MLTFSLGKFSLETEGQGLGWQSLMSTNVDFKPVKPLLSYLTIKLEPGKAVQTLGLQVWKFGFAFQPSTSQSLTFHLCFPVLHRDLHGH